MDQTRTDRFKTAILLLAVIGLIAGLAFYFAGRRDIANIVWFAGVVPALAALTVEILRSIGRGEVGLDIVAALSMTAALVFGETLAAAVVAVMYSGGTFLESFAEGRARHEMHDLLSRVPRTATRHRNGGLEDIPLEEIAPGDRLLIRQGDVVPVDGTVASDAAFVDTSALTGESLPVRLARGAEAMSGSTNAGEAFDVTATREAKDSTYAGIVRLVEEAQASKAPMSRLADRWSLGFLAVTVTIAFAAWWFTGDPIRAVAVLVVATPCPLILAVPVALVAGLSRAAHFGVLIKGAGPLETMARIRTLILDKTGTLTDGRPKIVSINSADGMDEDDILLFAASLDQASKHPVAQAVVAAAKAQGLTLPVPSEVAEFPGEGVVGHVEGRSVIVGGDGFVASRVGRMTGDHPATAKSAGSVLVAVAVDGHMVGHLVMSDPLREGAGVMLEGLRREGIGRILLATGDRADVAERVTEGLGLDGLRAGLTPDQKVLLVLTERKHGPVMMVGDGVNDAPALAAADVGVAMGARGAAASAEAADVVLLVDRIDRLGPGIEIARASRRIAVESVVAGIGLSVLGMIAAAFGYLTPVQGALLQEVIDVAVILNALRALRIVPHEPAMAKPQPATSGQADIVQGATP
ncbi:MULTISPECIES: heavy metal translocating P-type ATPase [Rhodobacterales]|jgi:heavy metal translocating P-type ATPase|uniref:P-type Zn(2+) transporter n=2 Tax=Rhodobacterales TaxID=204455 RepID=A0A2T5H8F0_9RHOB|nr:MULTISPECIES: heavy metal translocating P-type ATPase [Rhodobacterales]MAY88582.1 cadmium-translocating P-type ATPase [Pseudooceanicola sp.]MDW3118050.1 heavy metal translocating P-type ATPase [Roseovarius pacificus]MDE4062621.1 heavy metal translocating P-type ATPase [Phaeobacter gallaeciensis]MDE4125475.1 heavy metal translocating P-type ATPase [Phaeobacter gallaeciensis]MDE4130043.1 heavy metal translocating P-type ATPase [Phaeobacter gallaeciensis]